MKRKKALIAMFLATATLLINGVPAFASNTMIANSEEANIEVASTEYAITNQKTTMYRSKYTGGVVLSVPAGAIVEIRDADPNMTRILYNHKVGYVKTSHLTFIK